MKKILLNQYQVQLHDLDVRQKKVASGQTQACEKPGGSLFITKKELLLFMKTDYFVRDSKRSWWYEKIQVFP